MLPTVASVGFFPFSDNEEVIQPEHAKPNSLFIFNDVACEKQNNTRSYFCIGRHKKVDSFYFVQTYSRVPKQSIRDSTRISGSLSSRRYEHLPRSRKYGHKLRRVCQMCRLCWNSSKYGCMVIDHTRDNKDGRHRCGFVEYIIK